MAHFIITGTDAKTGAPVRMRLAGIDQDDATNAAMSEGVEVSSVTPEGAAAVSDYQRAKDATFAGTLKALGVFALILVVLAVVALMAIRR